MYTALYLSAGERPSLPASFSLCWDAVRSRFSVSTHNLVFFLLLVLSAGGLFLRGSHCREITRFYLRGWGTGTQSTLTNIENKKVINLSIYWAFPLFPCGLFLPWSQPASVLRSLSGGPNPVSILMQ